MKDRYITTMIVAVVAAVISGSISGVVSSSNNNENFQKELDLMKNQSDSQEERWKYEDLANLEILENLDSIKNNLEIKSEISVRVIPETQVFHNTVTTHSGFGPEAEIVIAPLDRSVILYENQTTRFDIYITNVGSDTTFVNRYTDVLVVIDGQNYTKTSQMYNTYPNGTSIDNTIGKILYTNSEPLVIPFWYKADPYIAPSGKMMFTVFYDETQAKTAVINYIFKSLSEE